MVADGLRAMPPHSVVTEEVAAIRGECDGHNKGGPTRNQNSPEALGTTRYQVSRRDE